jgi:serine acetyltransferase
LNLVLSSVFGVAYWILVDRIVRGFKPLPVLFCSIYEPAMWRHERYWKVPSTGYLAAFAGTPFINMILRGLGTRVGRRVFNDGCGITERSLVSIGDDCTLNEMSAVQCHSQEDGIFKSDYSTLGSNVTLATAAHVHYGVTIGDDAELTTDCFLMKGEQVPPGARWGGNPASELPVSTALTVRQDREESRLPAPAASPARKDHDESRLLAPAAFTVHQNRSNSRSAALASTNVAIVFFAALLAAQLIVLLITSP